MSSPYQPEPGCTARQRQLEQQLADTRREVRALEGDLGQARERSADLQARVEQLQVGALTREALLAEARDLLEPWGGHGDDWPAIGPAIETLIGKLNEALERAVTAEARLAELETDDGDWLTDVLYARKMSICWDEPVTLTARHLSYQRPVCPRCEWAAHPPLTCDEVRQFRERFDGFVAEGLAEIRAADSNLIGYRGVVNAPLTFETITALADKLKQGTMPRRKVQRSAPATDGGLTVVTTDPVQEIAADAATVDRLKQQFLGEPASRLGVQVGQIGQFFGFPVIVDADLPPGEVHMRPHPQTTEGQP
jgi:hypothetical protein